MPSLRVESWWGQAVSSNHPAYCKAYLAAGATAADNSLGYNFSARSNPFAPGGRGGECVFRYAYLTVRFAGNALFRITPYVDGSASVVTVPNGTIEVVKPNLSLVPRDTPDEQTFVIPLARRLMRGGIEQARWYLRGESLQLEIANNGPIGGSYKHFLAVEVEYDIVRKSNYPFTASGA